MVRGLTLMKHKKRLREVGLLSLQKAKGRAQCHLQVLSSKCKEGAFGAAWM